MSMTEYRAMCAELVDSVELLLEMRAVDAKPMAITEDCVSRARALLAQPVAEGPSDEDLLQVAIDTRLYRFQATAGDPVQYELTEAQINAYARAVLAKWGRPTPPAEGEVAEVSAWLRLFCSEEYESRSLDPDFAWLTRAAELLERPTPPPVAVSERLPGPEDCIKRGNDHWCWGQERSLLTGQASARWRLMRVSAMTDEAVNWLPANALPTPEATNESPN